MIFKVHNSDRTLADLMKLALSIAAWTDSYERKISAADTYPLIHPH